jgi:2-polyprenyl-3-methyl-5-hydroxy-6-metoxy-1,4-benzoquinol methylase
MKINLPEGYVERAMAPELDLVTRIHGRFKGTGLVMPEAQRTIYTAIRDKFIEDVKSWRGYPKQIHKPTVVDVGCGCGVGSNILSQEAQFVWGIDTNEESITYARQMFERQPNNIYYTPQVTFDRIDVMEEPREVMHFDYVVCVEVIEHIPSDQADNLVKFLNRFVKKNKNGSWVNDESRTKIYVTSPNRNSPLIQKETPRNEHHCYEATAGELYEYFTKHYQAVTVYNKNLEPQELNTEETPLVFKLEMPIGG